jgi:hypothetical protein
MKSRAIGYHAALRVLKGLGFLAALAGATEAAPKTDAQIFADYVKSAHHQAFLLKAFNDLEPAPLKAKCAKLEIAALDSPMVLQPPEFAQIGAEYIPSVGRWVQRATINRCGTKTVRRLYLQVDPRDGSLHALPMLPGEFPGNIQLENDATRIVLPAMMGIARCSDFKTLYVLDTRLTSPARPQGWSESWTAQACGRTVTADVIYSADATGMNITARNVRAR